MTSPRILDDGDGDGRGVHAVGHHLDRIGVSVHIDGADKVRHVIDPFDPQGRQSSVGLRRNADALRQGVRPEAEFPVAVRSVVKVGLQVREAVVRPVPQHRDPGLGETLARRPELRRQDDLGDLAGFRPHRPVALDDRRVFDPPGCGATTLAECLGSQLDKIGDPAVRARVAGLLGRLEDVAAGKVDDPEALLALRTLEPRPGRAYRHDARGTEYVNPEVHAVRCEDGWAARVDARSLPEIRISSKYLAMLEDPSVAKETKDYIRERIAAAKALVDAVARRRDTITDIAQEIFDRQPGFFEKGLKGLKPMTMQEIADELGIHETTVSRTVNGKYAATPKGTVELRRFFVQGVRTDSGETVARDGVIDRLKAFVEAEDKAHPLSDEKLSELLKGEGFPVARRTVAKYRTLAGIPGTSERRI